MSDDCKISGETCEIENDSDGQEEKVFEKIKNSYHALIMMAEELDDTRPLNGGVITTGKRISANAMLTFYRTLRSQVLESFDRELIDEIDRMKPTLTEHMMPNNALDMPDEHLWALMNVDTSVKN